MEPVGIEIADDDAATVRDLVLAANVDVRQQALAVREPVEDDHVGHLAGERHLLFLEESGLLVVGLAAGLGHRLLAEEIPPDAHLFVVGERLTVVPVGVVEVVAGDLADFVHGELRTGDEDMGVLARLERLFAERDLRELLDGEGDSVAPADFFQAEEVLAHDAAGFGLAGDVGDRVA